MAETRLPPWTPAQERVATAVIRLMTLANVWLAIENDLEIIPVYNKIDLPGADVDKVDREVREIIGLDTKGAIPASAKEGIGIDEILQAVVDRVPPPETAGEDEPPLYRDAAAAQRGDLVFCPRAAAQRDARR